MKKKEKKNNKIKILLIILLSILFILAIIFSIFYFVILNPQKNFNKLFNNIFDKTTNIIEKTSIDKTTSSINKGNIKIETNNEKYKNINEYEIEYDIENDRNTNTTLIDLNLGDEEESINSKLYYNDNYLYINFPYITSSMIKISLEQYDLNINFEQKIKYTSNDVNYISNIIRNSFINNINKSNLKNSISNYHIKSTYLIDEKELNNLLDSIINDLQKDDKSINILKEINLNNYKNNIIKYFNEKYKFIEINMYINTLLKLDKITINTTNNNIIYNIDKTNNLIVKSSNKEILNLSFNSSELTSKLYRNSKTIETNLSIDTGKDEYNFDGFINLIDENNNYIKLDLSLSTLLNEKITKYDTSEAKSYNQFTSKDLKSVHKTINLINKYIELFTNTTENNINLIK